MLGKAGRIANVFRQGFSSVGDDAARAAFATEKARAVAHAAAGTHDEYLSQLPELTKQFAGTSTAPDYTGVKGAVYGVGRGAGKVSGAAGGLVNAMGGPVGVAMTAPMALMMLPPPQAPAEEMGQEFETEEMRYARMLQQQAMQRESGGMY